MASLIPSGYFARGVQLGSLKKTQALWRTVTAKWSHVVGSWSGLAFRSFLQKRVSISGHICLAVHRLPIFPEGNIVILRMWRDKPDVKSLLLLSIGLHFCLVKTEERRALIRWNESLRRQLLACSDSRSERHVPGNSWRRRHCWCGSVQQHGWGTGTLTLCWGLSHLLKFNLMCWWSCIITLPYSGSLWVKRKFYSMACGTWSFSWAPLKRSLSSWWYLILFLDS